MYHHISTRSKLPPSSLSQYPWPFGVLISHSYRSSSWSLDHEWEAPQEYIWCGGCTKRLYGVSSWSLSSNHSRATMAPWHWCQLHSADTWTLAAHCGARESRAAKGPGHCSCQTETGQFLSYLSWCPIWGANVWKRFLIFICFDPVPYLLQLFPDLNSSSDALRYLRSALRVVRQCPRSWPLRVAYQGFWDFFGETVRCHILRASSISVPKISHLSPFESNDPYRSGSTTD